MLSGQLLGPGNVRWGAESAVAEFFAVVAKRLAKPRRSPSREDLGGVLVASRRVRNRAGGIMPTREE